MASLPALSFTDSLKSEQRKQFYEQKKKMAIAMILIVFLMPFIGVYVSGLFGAACGVVLSVLAFYLTPYVVLRMGAGQVG